MRTLLFPAALLLLLALLAHAPALRAHFIWDDDTLLTENRYIQSPSGMRDIWTNPVALRQYYPLVWSSLWLEHRLWGLKPFGYHAVNLGLHAINAVLAFVLLRKLRLPGFAAWLTAAVFAVHPMHVESVAWISERKNVLSAAFYLAAALAYVSFESLENDEAGPNLPRRRWAFYAWSLVLFVAALLSKTVTCTLPAALLVVLWWKRRLGWRTAVPVLPMFLIGVPLGLMTAWLEKHAVGARVIDLGLMPVDRVLLAGRALWFYAGKLLWPEPLMFVYPRWDIDPQQPAQFLYPLLAVLLVLALLLTSRRLGRGPAAALLFFGGTLFPALGFVDVYPMLFSWVADHFVYLASLGILSLACTGLVTLLPRAAIAPVSAVLLLVLGTLTFQRALAFHDAESLYRDTLRKNDAAWMAHINLAVLLADRGDLQAAQPHFERAVELKPDDVDAQRNLGVLLDKLGRTEQALKHFVLSLSAWPSLEEAYKQLGFTDAQGQLDLARVDPVQVHLRLGIACAQRKLPDAAEYHFKAVLRRDASQADALYNLGLVLHSQKRTAEALPHWKRAAELRPQWPAPARMLAWVLSTSPDPALRDGQTALPLALRAAQAQPGPLTLDALAAALAELGRFDEAQQAITPAIEQAEQAGRLDLASELRQRLKLYQNHQPFRGGR